MPKQKTATEILSQDAKIKRLSSEVAQWAAEARQKDHENKELRDVVKALRRRLDAKAGAFD